MGFFIMLRVLKTVFVIIGALIGAGFASGQEVNVFFFSYGAKGLFGILFASLSFGLVIYKGLKIITSHDINNYKELLDIILKNEKLKKATNIFINILILISFYVMIAGFGAYLNQEFNANKTIGSIILAIGCLIIFFTNVKGLVRVSELLIPLLLIIIVSIGIINIFNIDIKNISDYLPRENSMGWLLQSLLYASYNSILIIPVLIPIRNYISKGKDNKLIAIATTLITIILLLTIFFLLANVDVDINTIEMPAIYAVYKSVPQMGLIYGIIILISIFTTAISLGISFLNNVSNDKKTYKKIAILICATSILFSQIGFAKMISVLYPILGCFGLIQAFAIVKVKDKI